MIKARPVTPNQLERLMKRGWVPTYDSSLTLRKLNLEGTRKEVFLLDVALMHAALYGKKVWCTLSRVDGIDGIGMRINTNETQGEYASAVEACTAWECYDE